MASLDTKTRILDAAEELFATQGFSATSLRNVIAAADVNLAAVHYHFGSKERLIEAVFARRVGPLNARRMELLDAECRQGGEQPLPVERIVHTLIVPVVELAQADAGGTSRLARLFGRIHSEPDERVRLLLLAQFDAVRSRYLAELSRSLPALSDAELALRFQFAIGAMAAAFAEPSRLAYVSGGLVSPDDTPRVAAHLIVFLTAGLSAPPKEPKRPAPRRRRSRRQQA